MTFPGIVLLAVFQLLSMISTGVTSNLETSAEAMAGTANVEPGDWLYIDVQAGELQISDGATVEISGIGSLRFRNGRRTIGFPNDLRVYIDGKMVLASGIVDPGAEVFLVGVDGVVRWMLRQAFSLPRQEGTTITDDDPEATAAIDTAEETHFFLHIAEGGVTTFFHPTETGAEPIHLSAWSSERRARHAAFRSDLNTYFERLTQFGFSGSVLLAEGSDLVFSDAYGLADREDGRAFLPSTVVTLASVTKSFTATAILKLQEMGRLNIHDSIAEYLEDVPADKQDITLHHVLTHTSGLKRNGLEGGDLNLQASRDSLLKNMLQSDLLSKPGMEYRYSNAGYSLLAIIVENASGLTYEEFLYRYLLTPAGMFRTGYLIPQYDDAELANGYRGDQQIGPVIRLSMLDDGPTWNVRGNGALHSDSYDMYRWFLALRNYELLSVDAMRAMTMPHVDQGDGENYYGYGWEIGTGPTGTRTISHRGGNGYFSTDFHWLPDDDVMFFIGSNSGTLNMTRLADAVQAIVFDQQYVLPPLVVSIPSETLHEYEGIYWLPDSSSVTVSVSENSLSLQANGDGAIRTVLGGARTREDAEVATLAQRSGELVRAEFRGDFAPKFDAMGGRTPLADLERYHGYDREVWDESFGTLQEVEVVAAAGELEEIEVIVRLVFERGAAAQLHTWRDGRLANISVIPDWKEFTFNRTLYPVSDTRFESFVSGSSIRLVIEFEQPYALPGSDPSIVFPMDPAAPAARRIKKGN